LRFTNAAMASLGGVLKLDMSRLTGYRNFGTKLWNFARFAEMNDVFEVVADTPARAERTLNKWILGETARARVAVDAALEAYRFNEAANTLHAFVWGTVCDWYLEFSKPLLQGDDAATAAETRETMKWVLDQCLILLHPIMPFITEEIWGLSGKRAGMLIHADWPTDRVEDLEDPAALREMRWVIGLIEAVRSARAQMRVPAGAYVPMLVGSIDAAGRAAWDRNAALIRRLARIESLTEADRFPKGTITIPAEGASFGLPLADIIDLAAEKARLQKALDKLEKDLGTLRGRLGNPKFVDSAPDEIVAETREALAAREADEGKLRAALAQLQDID